MRILILVLLSPLAWADGPGYKCVNLNKAMEIKQRLDDHTYVAKVWYGTIPPHRVLLKTQRTKFRGPGENAADLWVKVPNKPEQEELQDENGFAKTVQVLHESAACEKEGPKEAAKAANLPMFDVREQPCVTTDEYGQEMINIHCKNPPKKEQAQIKKEDEERQAYVKLRDACEGGYKDASTPECQEVLKDR